MEEIVEIGKDYFNKKAGGKYIFCPDNEKADALINDLEKNPHAYVLACLMDRQMDADRVWMIPQKISEVLGTFDFNELQKISEEKFVAIFNDNKLHRFNNDMANIFYLGIQDIKTKYNGNAANIWLDKPGSAVVVKRFDDFYGVGQKISTMAANLLVRHFKIEFSDYYAIDVSADVHVLRVMGRMGYIPNNVSEGTARKMVIDKARELYPEFPGIIDFPCWEVGRQWCRPENPECNKCILTKSCKKVI